MFDGQFLSLHTREYTRCTTVWTKRNGECSISQIWFAANQTCTSSGKRMKRTVIALAIVGVGMLVAVYVTTIPSNPLYKNSPAQAAGAKIR